MPKATKIKLLTNGSGLSAEVQTAARAVLDDRRRRDAVVEIIRLQCPCGVETLWEVEYERIEHTLPPSEEMVDSIGCYTAKLSCAQCERFQELSIPSNSPDYAVNMLSFYDGEHGPSRALLEKETKAHALLVDIDRIAYDHYRALQMSQGHPQQYTQQQVLAKQQILSSMYQQMQHSGSQQVPKTYYSNIFGPTTKKGGKKKLWI